MLVGSILLAAAAAGLAFIWLPLALLVLPLWIFLFAFFRDPERRVPDEQHAMVSPADGRVADITEMPHVEQLGGPAIRVGIFLSVLNVHINRAPCEGQISSVQYKKGRFINAMRHSQASEQNESNTLVISDISSGRPVAMMKQIVGAIARRIVCTVQVGTRVQRGERVGMIKFGSRTELYIPLCLEPELRVTIGQAVRGAQDVIAVLRKPLATVNADAAETASQPITCTK